MVELIEDISNICHTLIIGVRVSGPMQGWLDDRTGPHESEARHSYIPIAG